MKILNLFQCILFFSFCVTACLISMLVFTFYCQSFWSEDKWNIFAPKDADIIENFHRHQAAFDELTHMLSEDKAVKLFFAKDDLDDIIDPQRRVRYKNLIEGILPNLTIQNLDGHMYFCFAGCKLLWFSADWSKGIYFFPQPKMYPEKLLNNLDNVRQLPTGHYFKALGGGWYLAYQRMYWD